MPKFSVEVRTETPQQTKRALEAAGIPSVGPASAGFTESPESWTTSDRITPVVEADRPEGAIERVRQAVGADPSVGPAKRYGD